MLKINIGLLVFSAILSFALMLIFTDSFIYYMKLNVIGQYIREDGPQKHLSKQGTPTMGGLVITASILLGSLLGLSNAFKWSYESQICLLSILGFAVVGLLDDYLKVVKKKNKGLSGWKKLSLQIIISLLPILYCYFFLETSSISLFGFGSIDINIFYIIFGLLVILGSSNAVNLTDGLDGLATSTSFISFLTLTVFLYKTGNYDLAIVSSTISAACLGFLFFNKNPAQVFMGDSGSLMLGGAFGVLGILGNLELWLIPIGFIFVIEALSVICQVASFKLTGKRILKMAPLHHHYELKGFKEKNIVIIFTCVQALFCILSLLIGFVWLF